MLLAQGFRNIADLLLLQPPHVRSLFPLLADQLRMEAALRTAAAATATALQPMQVDSPKETVDKELQTSLVETARLTLRQKFYEALLQTAARTSVRAAKLDAALAVALVTLAPSDPAVLMANIVRGSLEEDIHRRAKLWTAGFDQWRAATYAIPPGDLSADLEPHLAAAQDAIFKVQSKLRDVGRRLKAKLAELAADLIGLLKASEAAQDLAAAVNAARLLVDLERRAFRDGPLGIALGFDVHTYIRVL